MRNTLTSAAVGAAVAVVVAGTVSLLGIFDKDKRIVYATISLDRLSDGRCTINTIPQTLEVRRKETVEWTIVDRCGVTLPADGIVTITFANDPTNCTKTGKKNIKCPMKTDPAPAYQEYKYSVTAPDSIPEDPVLEIVQ
jgi:hypothetical protein